MQGFDLVLCELTRVQTMVFFKGKAQQNWLKGPNKAMLSYCSSGPHNIELQSTLSKNEIIRCYLALSKKINESIIFGCK